MTSRALSNGVCSLPLVHEDSRRRVYDLAIPGGSLKRIEVLSQQSLGNHYHERCTENYLIVSGGGTYTSCRTDASDTAESTVGVAPGDLIHIPPRVAHAFRLEPGTMLVCYSTAAFDENAPDVVPYPLLPS